MLLQITHAFNSHSLRTGLFIIKLEIIKNYIFKYSSLIEKKLKFEICQVYEYKLSEKRVREYCYKLPAPSTLTL